MKEAIWLGDSQRKLSDMPLLIRRAFGHSLWELQIGDSPLNVKALPLLGRGVCELRESFDANAYRLIYVANLASAVYVLDVFMKKSTAGIGLPKLNIERIKARYKQALAKEAENERGN